MSEQRASLQDRLRPICAIVGGIAAAMLLPIFNMSKTMRPGG